MPSLPSVLANSLPRGGPFLLSSALAVLGYHKYAGATVNKTPAAFNYLEAKKALQGRVAHPGENMIAISPFAPCYVEQDLMHDWLGMLSDEEFMMAHIPYAPALSDAMENLNCRHIAIIRDPRSLLLSLLFDTHPMPRFLIEPFATMSPTEQLEFMLSGGEIPEADMTLQPFAQVYRSMLAWQNSDNCLLVRFEDLVGSPGGGSEERQRQTVEQMAVFLGLPFDGVKDGELAVITDPSVSVFRMDQMSHWTDEVGADVMERVQTACEDLVAEGNYHVD